MAQDILFTDATGLAALIRSKQLSPVEVVKAHLDRIEAVDPQVNAIVIVAEGALAAARQAEAAVMAGGELGPLHGVPFTVKDSIDTEGVPTQRGSPIFKGRVPAADATSVARLRTAGGSLLAKTNLPEFSYWIESDNLLSGRSNNPWDLDRTPGGSSGGESAAIAAGMSPLGLGTDLAISVRGPAAQTGIAALKATHGRIPMTGIWPRAPRRFWHVGPKARSIRDLALAFSQLAGPDGQDAFATSAVSFNAGIGAAPDRPLRIGWMVGPGFGPIDTQVAATLRAAAEAFKGEGHFVEEVRIAALERDFALDVFNKLHVMEMKPAFREATSGHEDQMYKMAKTMLSLPDTSVEDYVAGLAGGGAAAGRLRSLLPKLRRAADPGAAGAGAQARHHRTRRQRRSGRPHLPAGRDRTPERDGFAGAVDAVRNKPRGPAHQRATRGKLAGGDQAPLCRLGVGGHQPGPQPAPQRLKGGDLAGGHSPGPRDS